LDASRSKPGDNAQTPSQQDVQKAPLWQKYFSRPSEQDILDIDIPVPPGVDKAPLWQKIVAKPAEQDAQGAQVPLEHRVETSPSGKPWEKKPMIRALHVEWPVATEDDELPMDDITDYFEGFGQILETDMPECPMAEPW